jgi:hypothetical protein
MSLIFEPETHTYKSIDNADSTKWISVTTLLSNLKQPFDSDKIASKSSKNKKSKWFGLSPKEIQEIWSNEAKRATDLGSWYHDQRESDLLNCETIVRDDEPLPVIRPLTNDNGYKIASSQKLINGIYPEHLVYMRSAGICGQSDLVEIVNNKVNIIDYKTNKEIKMNSFKNWEGIAAMMEHPVSHLEDCSYNHYNLQLSIYMFMILKHNPKLKPGKLMLHHIIFEKAGEDQYGYPIMARATNGDPIIKEIVPYDMPYLKQEVLDIMSWYKDNKADILKNKK